MCEIEDNAAGSDSNQGVCEDLGVFAWRGLGTRAVWTKSDPVRCIANVSLGFNVAIPSHAVTIVNVYELLRAGRCFSGTSYYSPLTYTSCTMMMLENL
jgi:hypothetical protein